MDDATRASFARIAQLFDELRELGPDDRRRGLEGIEDVRVRTEVERLLDAHDDASSDETGDLLDRGMPAAAAADLLDALDHERVGVQELETTGRWEAVREIGRGGMGTVWLARRTGTDFEQAGALKLLRSGQDDDELLRRFRDERRILAQLEHPNIAKFLDGGTTGDGKPFVVMEYVDGDDLIAHAKNTELDLRSRIEMFRKVCSAVEHAHASLVVHRDLKPSNILVARADGEPKLLDFGIAKLLRDARESEGGDARTLTGMMLLTPEYASPEQVRGSEFVTVATDVYALGLVLYELLTGQRAQAFTTAGATELARIVCETDPPSPSAAATRAQRIGGGQTVRASQLAGDLDAIVMKALRKEPEQRYASAAGLDEDLQRYLEGMPVRARRGTTAYRLSRFARRNRVPLAAAAIVFLLVIGASIGLYRQASTLKRQAQTLQQQATQLSTQRDTLQTQSDELRDQRDLARRESLVAHEVADFLIDLFDVPRTQAARAKTLTAREILDIGARRIEAGFDSSPLVRASLLMAMGRAYTVLGQLEDGERLLVPAHELREEFGSPAERLDGTHGMMLLRHAQARYDEAIALADRAKEFLATIDEPSVRSEEIMTGILLHKGLALLELADYDAAERVADELRDQFEHLEISKGLGDLHYLLARVHLGRSEFAKAEAELEAARGLVETMDNGLAVSNVLATLSDVQEEQGRFEDALATARRANEMDVAIFGDGHPRVDGNLYDIASLLLKCGYFDEAEQVLTGVIERDRERYGDHPYTAFAIAKYASLLAELGEFDRALELNEEALDIQRRHLGDDHHEVATTLANIGVVLADSGRPNEARPYFEQSISIRKTLFAPDHPTLLTSRSLMALALLAAGDLDAAETEYEAVYEGRRSRLGEHPETAGALFSLSIVAMRRQEVGRAEDLARQATKMYRATLPRGTGVDLSRPLQQLGVILMRSGREDEAGPLLRECVTIRDVLAPDHPMRVAGQRAYSECLWRQGDPVEAEHVLLELKTSLDPRPDDDPLIRSIDEQLSWVRQSMNGR